MARKWTLEGIPETAMEGVRRLTAADLRVLFQPIVDIATGRVFAHEALVRCKLPEYASPPVLFEHAVREEACGRLGRLIRDVTFSTSGDVPLFLNLHAEELTARWLVRPDEPLGFHSKPVFLEITESAMLTHFDLCVSVLKELLARTHSLLVIDDFGAGYSNLERLVVLEPSVVKLDIAVVHDIHLHKRKQIVVRHMVNLCADLGARVVAEGVELLDELKCVRDLGVHYAQGYLLAYPAAPPPDHAWPLGGAPARKAPPPLPRPKRPSTGAGSKGMQSPRSWTKPPK